MVGSSFECPQYPAPTGPSPALIPDVTATPGSFAIVKRSGTRSMEGENRRELLQNFLCPHYIPLSTFIRNLLGSSPG